MTEQEQQAKWRKVYAAAERAQQLQILVERVRHTGCASASDHVRLQDYPGYIYYYPDRLTTMIRFSQGDVIGYLDGKPILLDIYSMLTMWQDGQLQGATW